jgi:hypothetical protein
MSWLIGIVAILVLTVVAALGGAFLFGWKHRNDRMPDVAPLPRDDDD